MTGRWMMVVERRARIVNEAGLHARPCHAIVSVALQYGAELRLACDGREVNGRSILELMTLEAARGQEIAIWAKGEDAEGLVGALAALIDSGFGESS